MKIEYPSAQEQREAVCRITERGLARRSLFRDFRDLYRGLGLRAIFHDQGDVLFVSALAVFCAASLLLQTHISTWQRRDFYRVLFIASPTLYLLLSLLGLWKEKLSAVFDLKMTCRYTVCHLTAFRMLTFSCASIVFNLATAGLCCLLGICPDFWRMFMVSASGLFLFATALLYSLLPGGLLAPTLAAAAWVPVNLACSTLWKTAYYRFLLAVPLPLHLAVTAALVFLYVSGLKQLFLRKKENILC